jgi:acetyl esterase
MPIEQARRENDEGAPLLFGPAGAIASVEDLDARRRAVRVYRPSLGEWPGVVYCHGGAWVLGSLDSQDPLCRTLAARSSCNVISVGYRLAPEYPYPAALNDVWTAIRWAAACFSPLAVAGDSAGGQLAAAVALRARDAGIELEVQVLIYPATNDAFDTRSYIENADGMVITTELTRWFWAQYVKDEARGGEPGCSPLRADLSGVPPALILTAEHDPLRDAGEAYACRLDAAGVPVTPRCYDGQTHGFIRMPAMIDRAHDAIDEVAATLRSTMACGATCAASDRSVGRITRAIRGKSGPHPPPRPQRTR